jgi:P4 family phage/plasmid primase-like protien
MIRNHNQTDLSNFIVKDHIDKYGEPNFPTRQGTAGKLNQVFWAALEAEYNDFLFESAENIFYRFGEKIWQPFSDCSLQGHICNDLRQAISQNWPNLGLIELNEVRGLQAIISLTKSMVEEEGAFNKTVQNVIDNGIQIAIDNGVLKIDKNGPQLVSHSPEYLIRNLTPIAYVPGADCPDFRDNLLALLPEDDQLLLQKFAGMFLAGSNFAQMILILHGMPNSGKSTFVEIIRGLIGYDNVTELRTRYLETRFEIGRYIGKTLLVGADVPGDFLCNEGGFKLKGLVGGDPLTGERKGSNQQYHCKGNFNVLATSNERLLVKLHEDYGAWERRLALIEYEMPHAERKPDYAGFLLSTQSSGLLNWGIEGWMRTLEDLEQHGTIQLSLKQAMRVASLLNESDSLAIYLKDALERSEKCDISTQELLVGYSDSCRDQGWQMPSKTVTEKRLPDLMMSLFSSTPSNNLVRDNRLARGYTKVRFK